MQDIKKTGRKSLEYFIALNFPKQVVAKRANDTIKSKELPNSCFCLYLARFSKRKNRS